MSDVLNKIHEIESLLKDEISVNGDETKQCGLYYKQLGYLKYNINQYKDARFNFSKALKILRPLLSDENEGIIDLHYILAKLIGLERSVDEKERSKKYMFKVQTLREQYDEANKKPIESVDADLLLNFIDSTLIYSDLADVLKAARDYEQSSQLYLKTISLRRLKYGVDSFALVSPFLSLGDLLLLRGKYNEAKKIYDEALIISIKNVSKNNIETTNIMNKVALVHVSLNEFNQAEAIYLDVLNILKELLKENDLISVTKTCINLAELYSNMKDYDKSIKYYNQAIDSYEKIYGSEDIRTNNLKNQLSITKRRRSYYELDKNQLVMQSAFQYLYEIGIHSQDQLVIKIQTEKILNKANELVANNLAEEALSLYDILLGKQLTIPTSNSIGTINVIFENYVTSNVESQSHELVDHAGDSNVTIDVILNSKLNCLISVANKLINDGKYNRANDVYNQCEDVIKELKELPKYNELTNDLNDHDGFNLISPINSAVDNQEKLDYLIIKNYLTMGIYLPPTYQFLWKYLNKKIARLGETHVDIIDVLLQLVKWSMAVGKYNEAETYLNQGFSIIRAIIDKDLDNESNHQSNALIYIQLLISSFQLSIYQGIYNKLEIIITQIKELYKKLVLPKNNPIKAESLYYEAYMEMIFGNLNEADILIRNCIDIYVICSHKNHGKLLNCYLLFVNITLRLYDIRETTTYLDLANYLYSTNYLPNKLSIYPSLLLLYQANVHYSLGKYFDAYQVIQRAYNLIKDIYSNKNLDFIQYLILYNDICIAIGEPKDGLLYINDGINIINENNKIKSKDVDKCPHLLLLECNLSLGRNCYFKGNYNTCLVIYENTLKQVSEFLEQINADIHPLLTNCQLGLATIYLQYGRLIECRDLLKEAGLSACHIYGDESVDASTCLLLMGLLTKERGRYKDAKTIFSRCISLRYTLLGSEHPYIADVLHISAENLRIPGYYNDSKKACTAALSMRMILYGETNIYTMFSTILQSKLLCETGHPEDAEASLQNALTLIKDKLGYDSIHFAKVILDIGDCLQHQEKYNLSIKAMKQAIGLAKDQMGPNSLQVSHMINKIVYSLYKYNRANEALILLKNEVLPVYDAVLGKEHPYTIMARSRIGLCINEMKPTVGQELIDSALHFFEFYEQFPFSSNHPWVISLGGYPEDDKSQFSYSTEDQSTDISRPMTSEIIGTLDDNNDNELTLKLTSNKSSIDDLTVNKALEELNIDDTEYNSLNSIEYDDDNSFDTGSSDEFSNSSIETKIDKELKDVNRYRRSSRINSTVANQMNIPIPVALTLDLTTQTSPQVVAPVLTPEEVERNNVLQASDYLYNRAIDLYHSGNYMKSLTLFQESYISKQKYLSNDKDQVVYRSISDIYYYLGEIYRNVDQYDKSLENYKLSLNIRTELSNHLPNQSICDIYISIGNLYFDLSYYVLAKEYYIMVISIYQSIYSNEMKSTKYNLNIGYIYYYLGLTDLYLSKFDLSLKNIDFSIDIITRINVKTIDLSFPLLAKAKLYIQLGRYVEAKPLIEKSMAIRLQYLTNDKSEIKSPVTKKPLDKSIDRTKDPYSYLFQYSDDASDGSSHPLIAECSLELSICLFKQSMLFECKDRLNKIFNIYRHYFSLDHRKFIQLLYYRSILLFNEGMYIESLDTYNYIMNKLSDIHNSINKSSFQVFNETIIPTIHPSINDTINSPINLTNTSVELSRTYIAIGRYTESKTNLLKSLDTFTNIFVDSQLVDDSLKHQINENHFSIASIYYLLGDIEKFLGNYDQSKSYTEKALSMYRSVYLTYSDSHLDVFYCLLNISYIQQSIGQINKSIRSYNRLLKSIKSSFSNEHYIYMYSLIQYSDSLRINKQFNIAKQMLDEAVDIGKLLYNYDIKILTNLLDKQIDHKVTSRLEINLDKVIRGKIPSQFNLIECLYSQIWITIDQIISDLSITQVNDLKENVNVSKLDRLDTIESQLDGQADNEIESKRKNNKVDVVYDDKGIPAFNHTPYRLGREIIKEMTKILSIYLTNPQHIYITMLYGEIGIINRLEYEAIDKFVISLSNGDRKKYKSIDRSSENSLFRLSIDEINDCIQKLYESSIDSKHRYIVRLLNYQVIVEKSIDSLNEVEKTFDDAEYLRKIGHYSKADEKYDLILSNQIDGYNTIDLSNNLSNNIFNLLPSNPTIFPLLADTMYGKAECHRYLGLFLSSKQLYLTSISIYLKCNDGNESLDTTRGSYGLAELLRLQGLFIDSLTLHESILSIRLSLVGSEDILLIESLIALSNCFYDIGHYKESKNMIDKAYSLYINNQSNITLSIHLSARIIELYLYISRLDYSVGNYKHAWEFIDKAHDRQIQLYTQLIGQANDNTNSELKVDIKVNSKLDSKSTSEGDKEVDGGPFLSDILYHKAIYKLSLGKYSQAKQFAQQSLNIRIKYFGHLSHPFDKANVNKIADKGIEASSVSESLQQPSILTTTDVSDDKSLFGIERSSIHIDNNNASSSSIDKNKEKSIYPYSNASFHAPIISNMISSMKSNINTDKSNSSDNKQTNNIEEVIIEEDTDLFKYTHEGEIVVSHPLTAESLRLLGEITLAVGQLDESKDFLYYALTMYRELHGYVYISSYSASCLYTYAQFINQLGYYIESLSLHQVILNQRLKILGESHPHYAQSLLSIGQIYCQLGKYVDSKHCYNQSYKIYLTIYDNDNHIKLGEVIINQSEILYYLEEYNNALDSANKALAILKQYFHENHLLISKCYYVQSVVNKQLNNLTISNSLIEQSVSINTSLFGDKHLYTVDRLIYLGEILGIQGKYSEANKLLDQCLAIYLSKYKNYNSNHPMILYTMILTSHIYIYLSQYKIAKTLLIKIHKNIKKLLNNSEYSNHPYIGICLHALADILRYEGLYTQSKVLYDQVLTIYKQIYQEPSSFICNVLYSIGELGLVDGNNIDISNKVFDQCLANYRIIYSSMHSKVAMTLASLGKVLYQKGKYVESKNIFERALSMYRTVLGNEHSEIYITQYYISLIYLITCKYDQAIATLEKCYESLQSIYHNKHPIIGSINYTFGIIYNSLCNYEKAYSYLLDSLTIRQDIFPDLPNHPAIAESLFGIAENLRLRGYYEDINNKVIDLDVKDDLNDYNTDKLIDNSNDTLVKGSVGWDNETTNQTNKHSTKPNKKPLSKSDLTMALPVYEMSLHIRLSIYPKDHPLVMECEKGIADCLYMLGRLKPAHSLYVNVLIICYRVYGEEHVDTISAMISVTDILKSMGKLYPPDKQSDKPADRQSESKSEKQGDKQVEKPVDKSSPNLGSVSLIDHLSSAFSANVELTSVNNVWSPEVSNQISTVSPTNKKGQVLHPVLSTKKTTAAKDNVKTIGKLPNLANTNVNPNQRGYMGYAFPKTNPVFPTNTNSNKDVNNSNKIQYDSTKWLCDKMLSTYKKIYPNNDVTLLIVQIYYIKGEIAKAKKKPQFALNFYEKALTFSKQLFANKSDNMLINGLLYNAIGELSRNEHNYTNALTYYEKALVIFKNLYKNCPNHPNLSDVTSNIAMLFYSQGKYMEALPLFESSLEKRRIVFGTYHSSVAQSLNNYAGLLHTLGKYHEALPMYEESLAIKSKLFGQNHTDVASSMNNLGLLLKALGKYTEALSYYNQALLIQRKLYGSNHPHIASTLNNKASLLISMQQQLQAKDLYIEVIEMKRKIYGNDDPSVASSLNNLAGLLFNLNDIDRSMVLYEESLRIRKKYFTENHISVAESMNNIGLVLFSLGKLNEAFDYYENALRIKIKLMGERHPSVATSMHNLGGLLHKMKRYDEAKDWYSKAYDIRKFSLGENHMDTKASFENLKAIELDKIKQDKEISNKNNITLLLNTNTSNQIDSKLSGDKLISPGSSRDGEAMFSMNVSNSFDSGLPKY